MDDMSNRRRESRRKLTVFTPVYERNPRLLLGYVGDITLKGMLIIGRTPIPVNKTTILEIDFPGELPNASGLKTTIPARVAWCRKDENLEYYDIGIEFTEVTAEQVELFQKTLERYHFRHTFTDSW